MVEVVVAAIIFALAAAGIFSTISAMTRPAAESDNEVTAALIAKKYLEDMRHEVRADQWDATGAPLALGSHSFYPPEEVDNINYTINYTVRDDDDTDGRWVDIQVSW